MFHLISAVSDLVSIEYVMVGLTHALYVGSFSSNLQFLFLIIDLFFLMPYCSSLIVYPSLIFLAKILDQMNHVNLGTLHRLIGSNTSDVVRRNPSPIVFFWQDSPAFEFYTASLYSLLFGYTTIAVLPFANISWMNMCRLILHKRKKKNVFVYIIFRIQALTFPISPKSWNSIFQKTELP